MTGAGHQGKKSKLDTWLGSALKASDGSADLNVSVGRPPQVEVDGTLHPGPVFGLQRLTPFQTEMIALHVLSGDTEKIRTLVPSKRGELEITDVNNAYIREGTMTFSYLYGWWTDAGTFDSLLRAAILVAQSRRETRPEQGG